VESNDCVPFVDGEWLSAEPPINGDLASEIEWWLWVRTTSAISLHKAIGEEIDELLQRLFAKPKAAQFNDEEAGAERRGKREQRLIEAEARRIRTTGTKWSE
jgi:hypothetical protein